MNSRKTVVIQQFTDFAAAAQADDEYYANLSVEDRLREFASLLQTWRPDGGAIKRVAFVYPIGQAPKEALGDGSENEN